MFKVAKNLSVPTVRFLENKIMFTTCEIHLNLFYLRFSAFHDIERFQYLDPQIWNMVPFEMKMTTINTFKTEIMNQKPENCLCRLYESYKQSVGLVNALSQCTLFQPSENIRKP